MTAEENPAGLINPAYNPNSKASRFLWCPFLRWQVSSLVEKIPFLQYHQNTTGTLPRHHGNTQNMSKTPKTSPDTVKTLHYGHTTKVPPRHQRPPKQNWQTTKTPARRTQPIPKRTCKGFSQKVVANIFCHDIFYPSPSSRITINTTPSQQHLHSTASIIIIIIIIAIIFIVITFFFSSTMPTSSTPSTTTTTNSSSSNSNSNNNNNNNNNNITFHFWQVSICASTKWDTQVYMQVCKY